MTHKLKLIFFITSLFTTSVVLSQTKREILEEDPKQAANLRLELTPLNIYTSDFNSAAMWSIRGSYRANNKFLISGEFRKEYYDEQEEYIKRKLRITRMEKYLRDTHMKLSGPIFLKQQKRMQTNGFL